jgi:hypothetical protein
MYEVIDRKTKQVVGVYCSLRRASNKANKLDLEYGAHRYYWRSI